MTTLQLRKSSGRSPWHRGFLLITILFACFPLSQIARAVLPAPDGGYPGGNTAEGEDALFSLTTGSGNTANGFDALYSNATGDNNTATGSTALYSNTTGPDNTANGVSALQNNTIGDNNTASGFRALFSNTDGGLNTATGVDALYNNTSGNQNTASGFDALLNNTIGTANTATGVGALFSNTSGVSNTAAGAGALSGNTTGEDNTADGDAALGSNTTGNNNTAEGFGALSSNTTGNRNIALGFQAGSNLTTGSNNINIGNPGVAAESNAIRIGTNGTQTSSSMAGIYGTTVAKGVSVVIDSTGRLGTKGSAERFKDAIKPMGKASEAILALKPVSFRYKEELDPDKIPQFGLVAEEVEKVNPNLVVRGEDGKVNTVRYEAVNAMLLNEFLKEHRKVQTLEGRLDQQQKQIETLTAAFQKVSNQGELSKPAPR